jgi:trans-aconitate 2-methyltransferase
MTAAARDWDAETYDRISDVQQSWARNVLERLPLNGDETVLDAGCGSGRVTAMLLERVPEGCVIGVDSAPSMIREAEEALGGPRARFIASDLLDIDLDREADAVFSNAVFHWIPDHPRLFRRLFAALKPGGRLVAQCGGRGNVEHFLEVTDRVALQRPFREHYAGWDGRPWHFEGPEPTEAALRGARFTDVSCWLDESPETPEHPDEFLRVVCLGPHLERLPPELHDEFRAAVLEELGDPVVLDYVRLNIDARRPEDS